MTIRKKRGDTLYLMVLDDQANLDELDISAAVEMGGFYSELTVLDVDADAQTFNLMGDTAGYPYGSLDCDIKYTTTDGHTAHTYSFPIMIVSEVSQ